MNQKIKVFLLVVVCILYTACSAITEKVTLTFGASDCRGKNYQMVYDEFTKMGFKDIELKELADIKFGIFSKEGDVAEVSIGMNNKFKKGEEVLVTDKVYITYHVKEQKNDKNNDKKEEASSKETETTMLIEENKNEKSIETEINNVDEDDINFIEVNSKEDLKGDWIQINSESERIHMASVDDDTITIYVYFDDDESVELYWTGTFDTNFDVTGTTTIKSNNYKYITDYFPNTSHVEIKDLEFGDGCICYEATFLGTKEEVVLARSDSKDFDTIKLSGNRETKFSHDKNITVSFANAEFELPYYFDSKEETSTDNFVEYFPNDNSAYASFTMANLMLEEPLSVDEMLDYVACNIETADESHIIIDYETKNIDGVPCAKVKYSTGSGLASEAWFLVNNGTEFVCCGVTFDYNDKSTNDYLKDFDSVVDNVKFKGNNL